MGDVGTPVRRSGWWPGWPEGVLDLVAASAFTGTHGGI